MADCTRRQNKAQQGKTEQGKARQSKASQSKAKQGRAGQGKARQSKAKQGKAKQGKARQSKVRETKAKQGRAKQGKVTPSKARQGRAKQAKGSNAQTVFAAFDKTTMGKKGQHLTALSVAKTAFYGAPLVSCGLLNKTRFPSNSDSKKERKNDPNCGPFFARGLGIRVRNFGMRDPKDRKTRYNRKVQNLIPNPP